MNVDPGYLNRLMTERDRALIAAWQARRERNRVLAGAVGLALVCLGILLS